MDACRFFEAERLKSLRKPLDQRIAELVGEIERRPGLYLGDDQNVRCLFHYLNGWQTAAYPAPDYTPPDHTQGSLNEKMNAFLALKYHDTASLNWLDLLIRHEGEDAAYGKFFQYFHAMNDFPADPGSSGRG